MNAALATLLLLAAESGAVVGHNSMDRWSWSEFFDSFSTPALVIVGLTIILLVSLRIKKRNRDLARLDGPARGGQDRRARDREAIERMALDLEEVARSISALLDTRMRALEKLIRDADDRLARLKEVTDSSATLKEAADPASDERESSGAEARAEETLAHHASIYGLADQGLSVQEIAEQTGYHAGEVELVLSLRKATRTGDGE